jgi:hypothetical protein
LRLGLGPGLGLGLGLGVGFGFGTGGGTVGGRGEDKVRLGLSCHRSQCHRSHRSPSVCVCQESLRHCQPYWSPCAARSGA